MWYFILVAVIALMAGAAIFKHRQQIKREAEAEAYRVKMLAKRETERAEQYVGSTAKGLYDKAKSKLP